MEKKNEQKDIFDWFLEEPLSDTEKTIREINNIVNEFMLSYRLTKHPLTLCEPMSQYIIVVFKNGKVLFKAADMELLKALKKVLKWLKEHKQKNKEYIVIKGGREFI